MWTAADKHNEKEKEMKGGKKEERKEEERGKKGKSRETADTHQRQAIHILYIFTS